MNRVISVTLVNMSGGDNHHLMPFSMCVCVYTIIIPKKNFSSFLKLNIIKLSKGQRKKKKDKRLMYWERS